MRQQNTQARQNLKEIDDHLQQKAQPIRQQAPEKQVNIPVSEDIGYSFFDSL